ncbi:hypothetical protein GK047_18395 [Paenibacillus sp. SYP-B3998]|uniref:Dihydroorotate dehydrogenase catalytic domain-containing protein n=1 Tax=Paenibacillus sp. SYP-B3998 TaxID=2678564 RepID=A0A6G4A0I1_9BACL|nr:hypothetical protein [Paenibacillus sp. SYP-B3998]NEW07973.1 hypothetical protein [Paenibacillus sp. SYP-B3998]
MPDWSYHAIFRPLLFCLPAKLARGLTLHAMGGLSRIPGGTFVIKTMGHMELSPLLQSELAGVRVQCPVGLSGGLDPHGTANKALAQFGFGFIELGPVTVSQVGREVEAEMLREVEQEAIVYPDGYANDGVDDIVRRLARGTGHPLPHFVRLRPLPGSSPREALCQQQELLTKLTPYAAGFYFDGLDEGWPSAEAAAYLVEVRQLAMTAAAGKPLLVYVPQSYPQEMLRQLVEDAQLGGWSGVVIGEAVRDAQDDRRIRVGGAEQLGASLSRVRLLREALGERSTIIAAGGVHQPEDALALLSVGANCVQLHSGLVYAGPGLPKRVNEAIIYDRIRATEEPESPSFWANWGWMSLLGIGMMIGGVLAWLIATTSVLLPYDETFLGISRNAILTYNDRLLHFMSHDRITLAGTMVSIGIFYYQLAHHGLRYGLHWARTAVFSSCAVGFSSFFLYLGYGFFDPLHALAAAVLLPMLLMSMRGLKDRPSRKPPGLCNDAVWRRAQWGQCCFVVLGFALGIGGLTISSIGVTTVFVPTDLTYVGLSAEQLASWNERLIPLIAHDRAGFGGALFSLAVAITSSALWGVNQGEAWLWWTFFLGGLPGFAAGLLVHFHIGYTDFIHLLPVYIAVALYAVGLYLMYPFLVGRASVPTVALTNNS